VSSLRRQPGRDPVNVRDLNDPRVVSEALDARRGETVPAIDWSGVFARRLGVLSVIFLVWVVGIEARLVYLQVIDHDDLMTRATHQQEDREAIPGTRGDIVDRHGSVLAMSVRGHALMVARRLVADPDDLATRLCQVLAKCTAAEAKAMAQTMRPAPNGKGGNYAFLRREVTPKEVEGILALNEPALRLEEVSHRFYPNGETAAHLLGFVNADNKGQTGIEYAQDKRITGHEGRKIVQVTGGRPRVRLSSRILEDPTVGATVELTIDKDLQFIAERELEAGVTASAAQGGTVVVMDPMNGDILALANYPTFDPNDVGSAPMEARANRAAQEIYEPGSTFKLVTAAAAFQEAHMSPDRLFDVSAGQIKFGKWTIHDDHHMPSPMSMTDVIVHSSNVGAVKIGLTLGPEVISRYVSRFGFGEINARDIPFQRAGIIDRNLANAPDISVASVSMGYHVGVTPLQMAAAFSSVANGGELVAPRVVRAIVENGQRTEIPRKVVRRTVSPEVASQLVTLTEEVVKRGTGRFALQIAGYSVGGKTGTAQQLVNGHYSKSDYNASFVGIVPSRNPRFVCIVVMDAPKKGGYHGAQAAGPTFTRVAEAALRHLGVPPTINPEPTVLVERRDPSEAGPVARAGAGAASAASAAAAALATAATYKPAIDNAAAARDGLMPDVRGLSAREALRVLAAVGIEARLSGDGFVATQEITPGTAIERGQTCGLVLRRQLIPVAGAGDVGTQQ
jgi:cell division protein FtsI (penicillin-binding protein 3)